MDFTSTQNEAISYRGPQDGVYEEELPCGGTLKVTKNKWEIYYYFSGPDGRYNGTSVTVLGRDIEKYIDAYEDNWKKYLELMVSIPKGGEFVTEGKMGMSIRIGGFRQGICITSYHMNLDSYTKVQKVIDSYQYASERAKVVQALLQTLPEPLGKQQSGKHRY